nr:efflux RND transporter permease subunit [Saprospiraceae bacterium]
LHEIATVRDRWEDSPTRTYVNGQPGIVITVSNTTEEDMFANSDATQAYLAEFMEDNPSLSVTLIQDGKDYLNERISFIKENGLIGFFLVLILLAMFLNIRLAFWVALAIPISFAGMFMAASLLGITINVISTFGMVVVIGILVDDGIVIAENIYQHYEAGSPPLTAALEGTMEVLPAVFSAILTTVIAFSSFFFIEGTLGDIFSQLSVVVIFTLIFSLVEGALILPAHIAHSKALKAGTQSPVSRFFDGIMNFLKDKVYGNVLRFAMNYSFPSVAICVAALIVVVGAFMGGLIKGTFFPFIPFDTFQVSLEMPSGTREHEVYSALDRIEQAAHEVSQELSDEYFDGKVPVIEKVQKDIGPSTNVGQLTVFLMAGEERGDVSNFMITDAIRRKVGSIPKAEKLSYGTTTFFGDPVSISLLGSDPDELALAVEDLKDELAKITDLRDIQDSDKEGLKEINLELKPKAYNMGFTLNEIIRYVRQGFFGAEVQRLQRGADEVKVWVRYGLEDRSSLTDLAEMRIRTPEGEAIPLRELVEFDTERGVININHIDGQREIRVSADVANTKVSISDVNADIETEILPKVLERYPSVRVGFEGQARANAESQASMQKTMPIILLFMFFVVIMTFSSVSQAFVVFATLPFGFIGVGFGHWFMDQPISLFSVLGVIALVGILINDSLVFVSTFNDKIKKSIPFKEALYETGLSRFRPILLTTITTVAGLLPLLLEKSLQAQFLIPMAISVAFGLMITTFILLVMLPALLVITNRVRRLSVQIWTGQRVQPITVEPAHAGRQHPWVITIFLAIGAIIGFAILVFISFKISELIA